MEPQMNTDERGFRQELVESRHSLLPEEGWRVAPGWWETNHGSRFLMRALGALLLLSVFAGCAVYYGLRLDDLYGPADPARYDRPVPADATLDYWRDVKPIVDNRCVVCHGCYDAPCQVNLASYQGMTRGANEDAVYDAARLLAASPTRLFVDAQSNAEWRKKGFYPVLNERAMTPEANREASVLFRLLRLKRTHPLPAGAVLPGDRFDFSIDRSQQCPAIEEMDRFEQKFPQWGMPFGLPGLTDREYATLTRWIEAGAPYRDPSPLPNAYLKRIADWERFLNGDSLKIQLMSRYVFEHWFLGSLYFDDLPGQGRLAGVIAGQARAEQDMGARFDQRDKTHLRECALAPTGRRASEGPVID